VTWSIKKVIDAERGKALADEFGIKFVETSAKNSINVEEAFITLAKAIKERLIDTRGEQPAQPQPAPNPNGLIVVDQPVDPSKKNSQQPDKGPCCN